ncbi:MAG: RNA-binding S4 domain-containing protein [Rubrivivax sp.]|nr:RNA-binding S4 domain-containing protein [Rubrivivax sp.]
MPREHTGADDNRENGATGANAARVRLDKWLWAARLYKTRALATDEVVRGRISVNGLAAKPSRELHPGDRLTVRQGPLTRTLLIRALSNVRGPAVVAQALYEETADSLALREQQALQRRQGVEPAATLEQGRPSKHDRRQLADWQRWSASVDDLDTGSSH